MEEIISDLVARVQKLESTPAKRDATVTQNGEQWVFFPETISLIYYSPASSTDWIDSGSAKYIPSDARRAIVMAWVEDTDGGTGRTYMEARGGGVVRMIASLYETVDTADSSGGGDVHIPLSGGRFDYRATIQAQANIRIELVGYVK